MPSREKVHEIFKTLEQGFGPAFFAHVSDSVSWHGTGSDNPIGVTYSSKAETIRSFQRTGTVLREPFTPKVLHVLHDGGDTAAVELRARGVLKSGEEVVMEAAWFCEFRGEEIVKVRIYLDSALMKRLLDLAAAGK